MDTVSTDDRRLIDAAKTFRSNLQKAFGCLVQVIELDHGWYHVTTSPRALLASDRFERRYARQRARKARRERTRR